MAKESPSARDERSYLLSTMKDVAREAGVSVATVSCALSGSKNVSRSTMKKIKKAIEDLNYVPNMAARSLKTASSNEVGVILTDIDNSFHAELLKGISAGLQHSGYNVNVAFSEGIADIERERMDYLIGKNVAGMIVLSCRIDPDYFRSRLLENNLPTVFLERRPRDIECNYAGFNNRKTVGDIAQRLVALGYRHISLVCGWPAYSSEEDCIFGYTAVMEDAGLTPDVCHTSMSKEDAFKATMFAYRNSFPEAVITSSTHIAKGVLETACLYNRRVPDDVLMVSLGEESWNQAGGLAHVVTTERSAVTLGGRTADLLVQNISSPILFEPRSVVMDDQFDAGKITRPAVSAGAQTPPARKSRKKLKILMVETKTVDAIKLLSKKFTHDHGVDVDIEVIPGAEVAADILKSIEKENQKGRCFYDIYMIDVPWMPYIGRHKLLADITDFIRDESIGADKFLPQNLESCAYNGRYFAVPLMGGAQILFYRRDLFEDALLQREFEKQFKTSLHTPRTWTEYNGVCRFFTREFNPASPLPYGASVAAGNPEEFICYVMPYLWSHGGDIFDAENRPCLNSAANVRSFGKLMETLKYTDGNFLSTNLDGATEDFANGRTAMLVNFSEYVGNLGATPSLAGKVGYTLIPGKTPIFPGWNFGVSNYTKKQESIFLYLNWLCRRSTSYYLTILDGQSTTVQPYENNELRRLYPWLSLTVDIQKYCRHRRPPALPGGKVIPQNKMEKEVTDAFYRICNEGLSIEESLAIGQENLIKLVCQHT
jgi:multiple sugar transport system substrate-binding protein